MKVRLSQKQNVSLVKSAGVAVLALAVIGFVIVKVLLPQNSRASNNATEENYWIGKENSNWSDENNWSLGRAPEIADRVILHADKAENHVVNIPEGASYTVSSLDISGCQLTVDGSLITSSFIQLRSKRSELNVSGYLKCEEYLAALSDAFLKFSGTVYLQENFLIENAVVVQNKGSLLVKGDVELRRLGSLLKVAGGIAVVEGDFIAHQSQNEVNRLKLEGGVLSIRGATVFQRSTSEDLIPASIWVDGGNLEMNEVRRGRNAQGYLEGVYNFKVSSGSAVFHKDLLLDTLKEGEKGMIRLKENSDLWNSGTQYKRLNADDIVKVRYNGWVYILSQQYWASTNERPDKSFKWIEIGQADDEDKSYSLEFVDTWQASRVYKREAVDEEIFVQYNGLIYRMSKTCNLSKNNIPTKNKWAWILWYEPADKENFSDIFIAEGGHVSFEQDFAHWNGFESYGNCTLAFNGNETYVFKTEDHYQNIEVGSDAAIILVGNSEVSGDIVFNSKHSLKGFGTLTLTGSGIQKVRSTRPLSIDNMAINKDTGQVRLSGRLHVNKHLSWSSSVVFVAELSAVKREHLNATVLSFGADASISGQGWFEGPIEKIGKAAFTFPTGKNGKKAPISISQSSDTSQYRAEYFAYDVPGYKSKSSDLNCVSQMEYWTLQPLSKGSTSKITLHWTNGNWSQINSVADLVVAEFDGEKWQSMGQNSYTGSALSGAITSQTAMATATYYTYGSISNVNPLSQESAPINVQKRSGNIEFYASELPDGFALKEVQLSADSMFSNFESTWALQSGDLYTVDLAHIDLESQAYVRFLLVDVLDRTEKYSTVSIVPPSKSAVEVLSLYPNPVVSETRLSLESEGEQQGTVRIFDLNGTMLKMEALHIEKGRNEVLLTGFDNFSKGQYQLLIELNGYNETISLIKT